MDEPRKGVAVEGKVGRIVAKGGGLMRLRDVIDRCGTCPRRRVSGSAFTLVELMVVIVIVGILAALLMPTLSKGRQRAQGVSCLNNGKQMMVAMTIYGHDYSDFFPPNPDDGNTLPGHNWCSGQAGIGGPQEFDPDVLKDPERSLLSPYLKGNVSVFRCPSDKRSGKYQGTDPAMMGQIVPSARTFSMNQAVGTICPAYDAHLKSHGGKPSLPVNGRWLNNRGDHRRDSPWITYGKFSGIRAPGPAMLWVLLDEDSKYLNDAAFSYPMERPVWLDLPGCYHDIGCGFAFADGHSETHRWVFRSPKQGWGHRIMDPPDFKDWLWMRERTSAHISGAMPDPQF